MNRLLPFMKGPGAGKTASRSLSREDARQAMAAILDGEYHPVTLGGFLLALRFKGETTEEVAGFLDAMAERVEAAPDEVAGIPNVLDCSASYDGKVRTLNVGVAAALVAVGGGARIHLHGSENVPTKCGMTTGHVLQQLGIGIRRTPDEAVRDLHDCGISYLHQPDFHPAVHALLEHRQEVGKRTILNTLEPLSNPLGIRSHLGGVFHDAYGPLACEAAAGAARGFTRTVMVKGIEGSDELRPGAMHLFEWRDGALQTVPVDSATLGLPSHISDLDARSLEVEELSLRSAGATEDLLKGCGSEGYRNVVLLNAAVRLYAAGCVENLAHGVEGARESLASGAALQVLRAWRSRQQACRPAA